MGVNTHPVAGLHVSVVHALLSLQVIGVNTHPVAGLQVSVVHALLSLQVMGVTRSRWPGYRCPSCTRCCRCR